MSSGIDSFDRQGPHRSAAHDELREPSGAAPCPHPACHAAEVDQAGRQRIEALLRKSEEKFSKVFRSSPAAISITTLRDGRVIDVNDSLLRLLGCTREEIIGRTTLELEVWADREERRCLLQGLAENGSVRDQICHFRTKGGRILTTRYSAEVVELDGEDCILSLLVDITGLVESEAALRDSEQRYSSVIEAGNDCVWEVDLQGWLSYVSPHVQEVLGFAPEELLGKNVFDLMPAEVGHRVRGEFESYASRQMPFRGLENVNLHKSGRRVTLETNGVPVFDAAGRLRGYYGTARDISQRKQVEDALRRSEEMYRSLVENVDAGIALIDPSHTIVAINSAQARMFGKTQQELIGKRCFREFEKHDAVCPGCHGAAAMATGQATECERQGVRDDGTSFAARVKAFPLYGPDGVVTGFIELVEDVSKWNRAQEMLRQAKEAAEAANRAKSEFLANVSHEIRTPLTAILGYAQLISDSPDPAEIRDAAGTIQRNGEHLLQVISDILDLSKIEAARLEPEFSRCDPQQIVDEVAALMHVRLDAKSLRLEVDYEGPIPDSIRTDPLRLRQILINLVGNAVKFTETGGVRIVTRLLQDNTGQPKLNIDVIDSGIGLEAQQIDLLFQPFTQVDGSTRRKFGGSGLGLAISKRLAAMLGGDITVRSAPGVGSTFSVTVTTGPLDAPTTPRPAAHTTLALPPPPDDGPRLAGRVLLVEDGPDNQRLISFVLRRAGADVTVAENGQVALEQVATALGEGKPIQAILMDMQMPVLDGYEATARLRESGFAGPIIALTAHAMPEDRRRCLSAGCDDYLTKPVVFGELVRRVAAMLHPAAFSADVGPR